MKPLMRPTARKPKSTKLKDLTTRTPKDVKGGLNFTKITYKT